MDTASRGIECAAPAETYRSLPAMPKHDHDGADPHETSASLANTASIHLRGYPMGQLRTANKRHKRAALALQIRKKPVKVEPAAISKPAEAVR